MGEVANETIVAAAVMGYGKVWSLPAPARHSHVLDHMAETLPNSTPWPIDGIQGFVTSSGRFLPRILAARVAVEAGQIDKPKWGAHLYSEDLW